MTVGSPRVMGAGADAALRGTGADGQRVRDVFPQLHTLLPVRRDVCDPPAGGVGHMKLGQLSCSNAGRTS